MLAALRRPDVALSGLLAVLVHVALFVFLVVGLQWKRIPPPKLAVELWREIPPAPRPVPKAPPVAAPRVEAVRPPKAAEPPPKPAPAVPPKSVEPPPAPMPKVAEPAIVPPPPKSEPAVAKTDPAKSAAPKLELPKPEPKGEVPIPDSRSEEKRQRDQAIIDDRQRREERRRVAEALQEEGFRRAEEQKRIESERSAEADAKRRAEEQAQSEDMRRLREALQQQQRVADEQKAARERTEAERRAAVAAAAKALQQLDEYTARIQASIREKVSLPPGIAGNPQAVFEVRLLKSGTVASVRLAKPSGVPAYDRAVERAIEAAQPLPVPDDIELFQQLRDLTLVFRPAD